MTAPREDLEAWLRFDTLPGLSGSDRRDLLKEFGSPERALASVGSMAAGTVEPRVRESKGRAIDASLAWAALPGHRVVTLADAEYPERLLQIGDPPLLLFCAGRLELLSRPSIAIVGSRNSTPQGSRDAEQFARRLGDCGLTVVSGLALGIDASAHRGGLASSSSTVAVLGTGIDVSYPKANSGLQERIGSDGLLVSEYLPGTPPVAGHFPRRNRLISGLSLGCLVVEATRRSGSLITARFAVEQGREVFAMPGSIHSPFSKGCHDLIRSGAKLVDSVDDILSELSGHSLLSEAAMSQARNTVAPRQPRCGEDPLLRAMGDAPVDAQTLSHRLGASIAATQAGLLSLELRGAVVALPGALYQRIR